MDWKTSNHMDGSEIRDSIGLQYFAEDGNTSDSGADMDGFNGDDFLAALEGNDGLEDQQTAAEAMRRPCRTVRRPAHVEQQERTGGNSRGRRRKQRCGTGCCTADGTLQVEGH